MHKAGSSDIETARRLRHDQDLWIESEFPRQKCLLQIAAGKRASPCYRSRATNVEGLDLGAGEFEDRRAVEETVAAKGSFRDAWQHHAVGERQVSDEAGRHAILGDAAKSHRLNLAGRKARNLPFANC